MKPHGAYVSQIVFCWLPTDVWASDYYRDGFVWFGRAERRTYRNGRVKFFRLSGPEARSPNDQKAQVQDDHDEHERER